MRLAVLSDIHGNLAALDAVLADLAARGGADQLVVAGDLCLDGPLPAEALDRVRALGCPVVQGNTDRDLARTGEPADGDLAALLAWTRDRLGPERLAYLRDLPFAHRVTPLGGGAAVLVVHANPRNLDDHLRPLAPEAAIAPLLAGVPEDVAVVAFGHLHIPYTRAVGRLTLADIASVGLPKDGDPRAGYGLLTWDGAAWAVEQRRVAYAVDTVVAQLRAAAPPGVDGLVHMLLSARYPDMARARGGHDSHQAAGGDAAPTAGAERATKGHRAALDPDAPFGPAADRLLRERLATMLARAEAIRAAGDDVAEAVHDTRVAGRRLRAALDAAEPVCKPKRFRRFYRAVVALADALGAVREDDVALAWLRERLPGLAPGEREGVARLVAAVETERAARWRDLLAALDRWRVGDPGAAVARLVRRKAREGRGGAAETVGEAAERALAACRADFADHLGALDRLAATEAPGDPDAVRALHALRVAAKRLRYTLELFAPMLPGDADDALASLKRLQADLGDLHDREALVARLVRDVRALAAEEAAALARQALAPGERDARLAAPRAGVALSPGHFALLIAAADEWRERRATLADDDFRERLRALGTTEGGRRP
ncbi:MAG TPA: CHAD domain-containing protein [Thermomicrobiales bacterium]|nr:CHAD domain-containing protein [Thermomicrobiales bacterium]